MSINPINNNSMWPPGTCVAYDQLIQSIKDGDVEDVKNLIEARVFVNSATIKYALEQGASPEIIKYLRYGVTYINEFCMAGADLHQAIEDGDLAYVQDLVRGGVGVDSSENTFGQTALQHTLKQRVSKDIFSKKDTVGLEIVRSLLDAGAAPIGNTKEENKYLLRWKNKLDHQKLVAEVYTHLDPSFTKV